MIFNILIHMYDVEIKPLPEEDEVGFYLVRLKNTFGKRISYSYQVMENFKISNGFMSKIGNHWTEDLLGDDLVITHWMKIQE